MKIGNLIYYLKNIVFCIRHCRNWLPVLFARIVLKKQHHVVKMKSGEIFYSPKNNATISFINEVFLKNCYFTEDIKIDKNDIVVDIGANIGIFSVFAAGYTSNTVYSYEPVPRNFEYLTKNITANGCRNVKTFRTAVGGESGSIELSAETEDNMMAGKSEIQTGTKIKIPKIALKDIFVQNKIETIDFLKIDCEGYEGQIFRNLPFDYLKRIRKIAMEFHGGTSVLSRAEMAELFRTNGFAVKTVFGKGQSIGYIYANKS